MLIAKSPLYLPSRILVHMAAFYIHIPFCSKVCYYCDFHFSVYQGNKEQMVQALAREIQTRAASFEHQQFDTLYFGGGTPSVLSIDQINFLIEQAKRNFCFSENIEVTLEANPDDLSKEYLQQLAASSEINRLSIGIQSFDNTLLKIMNRRHNAGEAIKCLENAAKTRFDKLNGDLIYGFPNQSTAMLKSDLAIFAQFLIPHISAYHLSIEPKTVFAHYQKTGRLKPVSEEISTAHYEVLTTWMAEHGYEHYEISNFAREQQYSKHNMAYWLGDNYIGIGPSAHSRNGLLRQFNHANNQSYIESVFAGNDEYFQLEELNKTALLNEYLLTSLRTKWGMDELKVGKDFGVDLLEKIKAKAVPFLQSEDMWQSGHQLGFTTKGRFISDYIFRELFE